MHYPRLRASLPVLAFFAGFLWDTFTIGRRVTTADLWILLAYLLAAAAILAWLGYRHRPQSPESVVASPGERLPPFLNGWTERAPYLLLQFFFGGLFSALFILYFKSSSHFTALVWSIGLGVLLVANEFLSDRYQRFTLTWALFGLCAMLLFNFLLPFWVGGIGMVWFYLSTLAGAACTHWLRKYTPGCPGRAAPVWLLAALLTVAYSLDIIPPVPLVKRDIQVGKDFEASAGEFRLRIERAPRWVFWRQGADLIPLRGGERLYCVSSVFSPRGIKTRLYHNWERYDTGRGWVSVSRIGFDLVGGRNGGFRGYTYKKNLPPGRWQVRVETENGRTVVAHSFGVVAREAGKPENLVVHRF